MDKTVPSGRVKGTLTPPCSKSYAQRALAASLLCEETSVLRNIEFCSDTRSALRCIETLGARVTRIGEETLSIEGGLRPQGHTLRVGESGLSTRLFTPIASLCGTPITIEGEGTLLRRPMEMMIGPLRTLGVRVRDNGGFLPFEVRGPIRGGEVDVDGSVSSQFITGLMLALPLARHDTTIHVRSAVSTPYLDMTIDTAARFGVEICHNDYEEFYIEGGQRYSPACLSIEGDWSAAAMLLAAGLLQRTDSGVTAVLGILGYNVLYLLLIVLGDNASRWHLWLGLLAGLADGCYWLSYGHLLSDSTDLTNRDSGLAIVNICANVVNLTIPLLAGFIIDAVGGTRGYMAVFGLSFAVSAVTCALALRLPKRRMAGAHKVDYPRTLRAIGRNRHLLYSLAAQGCKGVREGAFTFILSIVLYQMVKNELLVGFNTFLSAAAAIASYVIASRILSLANRVRYMGIAVAVLTGIAALCILHLSPMTVILYTVVNSFFAGFLENSTYSTFLDMMQLVPEMDDHRPELLAVNDTVLELGRCVGLSIIIVMNVYVGEDVGVQVWSLLVLTLTQVGTVLLCRGAMRSAKQAAPGA